MSAHESLHLGERQLDDYADGAMSAPERAMAERHLAVCETCRRAVDETRAVWDPLESTCRHASLSIL